MKEFINTLGLACSTIECLQWMHNSIVTAFSGKQDYTNPNKEVPPKDAQLRGLIQYINTQLKPKMKCLKKVSKGKGATKTT